MSYSKTLQNVLEYTEKNNVSGSVLSRAAGISAGALSAYLSGKYTGNITNIESKLQAVLDRETEKKAGAEHRVTPTFVETNSSRLFFEVARLCHLDGEFGVCYGDAGLGKTMSAWEYSRLYSDSILIEADVGYTPRVVASKIFNLLCNGDRGTIDDMRDTIIDRLKGSGRLIIVDEAENLPHASLELLRRICDKSGVGLLLSGMPRLIGNLTGQRGQFAQLYSRVGIVVKLIPASDKDTQVIVQKYIPVSNGLWKSYHQESKGNPRRLFKLIRASVRISGINHISIDADVIKAASRELLK